MRSSLLVFVLLLASCKKKDVTAPNTELVTWTIIEADTPEIKAGKVGKGATKEFAVFMIPPSKDTGPIELSVSVELSDIDVKQLGRTLYLKTPTRLTAKVVTNADWVASAKCEKNPAFQIPTTLPSGETITPGALVLDCGFTLSQGPAAYGTHLRILGDGTIQVTGNNETTVTVEPR